MKTFETLLFPQALKWRYAMGNVSSDFRFINKNLKTKFTQISDAIYRGWRDTNPNPRIGILSLFLPVACNARCPGICFTDIQNWKQSKHHATYEEIISILEEFKKIGGKMVRIIGDGEPVLYRNLTNIAKWCRKSEIDLIVFTNGILMPQKILEEYKNGNLYFYVKLWSENIHTQAKMVDPRIPYQYRVGVAGPAPKVFYDLYSIDPKRVGFQVMTSGQNIKDAMRIVTGPKKNLPIFAEPFIPEGSGKNNKKLIVKSFPCTKTCEQPPRCSYLAVVNSSGLLQAGTFVKEGSVSIKGKKLAKVWTRTYATNEIFFKARYSTGCFCEAMRITSQKK